MSATPTKTRPRPRLTQFLTLWIFTTLLGTFSWALVLLLLIVGTLGAYLFGLDLPSGAWMLALLGAPIGGWLEARTY